MRLQHGRVTLELHVLKSGQGQPLLLLHALGSSAEAWPEAMRSWDHGPVYALDFAGHGKSGRVQGGAYHPEYFLADADLALEAIGGSCALAGAGIGAYVALLLAGARPDRIPAAGLIEGAGLAGGGSKPEYQRDDAEVAVGIEGFEAFIAQASRSYAPNTDPYVAQCERDMRPLDYVESFARAARPLVFSDAVGTRVPEPDWWQTVRASNPGARPASEMEGILERVAEGL